jgi:hypothetical protein
MHALLTTASTAHHTLHITLLKTNTNPAYTAYTALHACKPLCVTGQQGEGEEACVGGVRGLTPWGVSARVPQAVDWSLNARMWGLLQGESEGCVLHDALRLLSRGVCLVS